MSNNTTFTSVATKIINRGRPARSNRLRLALHNLPLNGVVVTRHRDAVSISGSLSRTAKRHTGTYFSCSRITSGKHKGKYSIIRRQAA